ncbi:histidine kinase [Anopheles sinensis]|uniref:Histidine kinase n=1 Tax=Anopheles sinensis TaxID=74873 RepID=A0A084WAF9_ANOSI|nr:histidine kinase [Anopheles sinensis]
MGRYDRKQKLPLNDTLFHRLTDNSYLLPDSGRLGTIVAKAKDKKRAKVGLTKDKRESRQLRGSAIFRQTQHDPAAADAIRSSFYRSPAFVYTIISRSRKGDRGPKGRSKLTLNQWFNKYIGGQKEQTNSARDLAEKGRNATKMQLHRASGCRWNKILPNRKGRPNKRTAQIGRNWFWQVQCFASPAKRICD